MSDTQTVMKFKLLPNEILLQCFEYLQAPHIFHSFDQLNYHFNKLIRSILLHLDFEDIYQGIICDRFCTKILCDEEIKKLSNIDACYPIQSFLSTFSFNQFPHLRSLTLTKVKEYNISQLTPMLSSISQVSRFHLIDSPYRQEEVLSHLSISQLQTLTLLKLPEHFEFLNKISSIINVTISECHNSEVCHILNNAPRIKYFSIRYLFSRSPN
jgi:hypothetical protein